MNNHDKSILVLVLALVLQTGLVFYIESKYDSIKEEAVTNGYAEWVVSKDTPRAIEFKWKEKK